MTTGSNTATRLEIMVNNNLTQDAVEIAIAFNSYFIDSVIVNDAQPVFIIREVSESKLNKVISSVKNSKAKDVFGLDSTFLKKLQRVTHWPHY